MQGRPKLPESAKMTDCIKINIKPELKKKLFKIADERSTTASQIIRDEIVKWIKAESKSR